MSAQVLQNYIGGKWATASATENSAVRNPATDEVLGTFR